MSLRRRPLRLCAVVASIAALVLIIVFVPKKHESLWGFDYVRSSFDWAAQHKVHPVTSLIPLPSSPPLPLPAVQYAFPEAADPAREALLADRRDKVKAAFIKSWTNYKKYAWTWDEIEPVLGLPKDTLGGWAATLVDSLDTLWIMGLHDEFYDAVAAAVTLDFGYTPAGSCNFFEVTIRHLGGLLAAYDLSKERVLLEKATDLGEMLYAAFDTPTQMPPFLLNFGDAKSGYLTAGSYDPAAAVTSFGVEFTRLSQLTGDNKYYDAQARLAVLLDEWQNRTTIPGLWPLHLNLQKLELDVDSLYSIGAMGDSLYEYFPKVHAMLGGVEPVYEKMYRQSMDAVIKHLMFRPMTRDQRDILLCGINYVAKGDAIRTPSFVMEHLTCFAGGMFALGSKLFDIPEHMAYAEKLTKGCVWAYEISKVGIAPEKFSLIPCVSLEPCEWDDSRWYEEGNATLPDGFKSVQDPRYLLRPEAIESVFVMYRVTGDEAYQEMAWRMFEAIVAVAEAEFGFSTVEDVTVADVKLDDAQETFWLSETLKYFYLIFAPPDMISLDDYILNTEAHPLLRPIPGS
ncbi:glycoside hydrolase [Microdochium trichocladiopsis]|uniref:alpha-1,2-Mannosidase n=1 Tax=Microdochium trichocladiopsis TaxID=1682393 RepID=A0A9P8Y1Z1_9PEZI|nr:glycoside hydrolase [Microdochium trichocladiopsis]KAH7027408.1 glycoside hydrolase [Microdochium trichocladiopsis]